MHILFSVSIRFVCHFVMFLWFYISRQFCVFIIASNALLFHLEICYKKKPFLALKRLFPFGIWHLTPAQTKQYTKVYIKAAVWKMLEYLMENLYKGALNSKLHYRCFIGNIPIYKFRKSSFLDRLRKWWWTRERQW